MPVIVNLTAADGHITATHEDAILAITALAQLPTISKSSNPYRFDPYGLGQRLYRALGGDRLQARIDADADPRLF